MRILILLLVVLFAYVLAVIEENSESRRPDESISLRDSLNQEEEGHDSNGLVPAGGCSRIFDHSWASIMSSKLCVGAVVATSFLAMLVILLCILDWILYIVASMQ